MMMMRRLYEHQSGCNRRLWRRVHQGEWDLLLEDLQQRLLKEDGGAQHYQQQRRRRRPLLPTSRRRYLKQDDDDDGNSVTKLPILSFAICKRAPVSIIQAMIALDPVSVSALDSRGRLPVHIACLESYSTDVVDLLLLHHEQAKGVFSATTGLATAALLQPDFEGNLPLHHAVEAACRCSSEEENRDEHLDILATLLVLMPSHSIANSMNHRCETPIGLARHYAARGGVAAAAAKIVYSMLQKTTLLFEEAQWEEATCATTMALTSCSFSAELDLNSAYWSATSEDDDEFSLEEHHDEFQATGERPPRRNASADILALVIDGRDSSKTRSSSSSRLLSSSSSSFKISSTSNKRRRSRAAEDHHRRRCSSSLRTIATTTAEDSSSSRRRRAYSGDY